MEFFIPMSVSSQGQVQKRKKKNVSHKNRLTGGSWVRLIIPVLVGKGEQLKLLLMMHWSFNNFIQLIIKCITLPCSGHVVWVSFKYLPITVTLQKVPCLPCSTEGVLQSIALPSSRASGFWLFVFVFVTFTHLMGHSGSFSANFLLPFVFPWFRFHRFNNRWSKVLKYKVLCCYSHVSYS